MIFSITPYFLTKRKNQNLDIDKPFVWCYLVDRFLTLSHKLRERCEHGFLSCGSSAANCRCRTEGYGIFLLEVNAMETRVAVMSIIVENGEAVEKLNAILHEYGEYIIGRMGIPYRKRKVNIIAIALDAPQNTISALAGKVGSLQGITVKTAYSGVTGTD